jgi:hypothetical protein
MGNTFGSKTVNNPQGKNIALKLKKRARKKKSKGEKSMPMKRVLQSFIALSVLMVLAAPSWSANVGINLSGTPTSAKQGETKSFNINISATGKINLDQIPATVTVDTDYTAGGVTGTPNNTSIFSAPSTNPPCDYFTNPPDKAGQCKPSQEITGGPFSLTANVIVPIALAPGTYTITVVATAGNGLTLPNPLPSFDLIVEEAGEAPSVSIITPANGGSYLVNQAITPAAEVLNSPSIVTGALNSAAPPVAFVDTGENDIWQAPAPLTLTVPGTNTYKVTAENSFGTGEATSTFNVHYNFGGWLPPITTAKFQRGRTLPVKFRVNDYSGPTSLAVASVFLDGTFVGFADSYYDSLGLPYYQLEVKLDVLAGSHQIRVVLDDAHTQESYPIMVR